MTISFQRRAGAPTLLPLLAGALVVVVVAIFDAAQDADEVVVGIVVLGPFLTAILGTPRQTAIVAGLAVAYAVASGVWNDNFFDASYLFRLAGIVVGGAIAVVAAINRERATVSSRRFGLLSAIADVADGSLSLSTTAERLGDLIVPDFADQCLVDTTEPGSGALRRLSARVDGPDAEATERYYRERPPTRRSAGMGAAVAVAADGAQLIHFDERTLQAVALDDEDLAVLRGLDIRSAIITPLRTGGRIVGVLTLVQTGLSRRRFTQDDLVFQEVVAGRVALALANAGLNRELREAERQLGVVLDSLDEAVTVTAVGGGTRYANDAALELLGFDDPAELYAASPGELMDRFDVYDEAGEPVPLEALPSSTLDDEDAPNRMLVRNVVRATGVERWLLHKVTPITDDDGTIVRIVNVIEDVTPIKLAELRSRLLAEASDVLASSLDYERTLQQVAELAVPGLADWCGVALPDDRGFIRTVAVAHADPAKVTFARELAQRYPEPASSTTGVAAVIRDGTSQRLNHIPDELLAAAAQDEDHLELLRGLGFAAALVVPMRAGGRVVGALSLISAESGRSFSADDLELAEELAGRAGTAVENARLFTERARITETLQEGLLPADLPSVPGWSAAALYNPAGALNDVGGDFYDVFETPGGWMVIMGDVTGHGAQAAKLTAVSRFALRAVAELTGDPMEAIHQLNRMLLAQPTLSLVTVACAVLGTDPDGEMHVDVIRCGHPAPLLASGGEVREVAPIGPIVGAFDSATWEASRITLRPGDALMLYTDGIIEASGDGERFGLDRLIDCIRDGPTAPAALTARVGEAVAAFRAGPQRDDEALVALQLAPVTQREPASAHRLGDAGD